MNTDIEINFDATTNSSRHSLCYALYVTHFIQHLKQPEAESYYAHDQMNVLEVKFFPGWHSQDVTELGLEPKSIEPWNLAIDLQEPLHCFQKNECRKLEFCQFLLILAWI